MSLQRLLFRPLIQDDESLSSWIGRLCLANLQRPKQVLRGIPRRANGDHDLHPPIALLGHLASIADSTCTRLARATATRYSGEIIENMEADLLPHLWLPYAKRAGSNGPYVYCPVCLSDPQTAYFRIGWRLAIATVCPKHRCLLHDRCLQCQAFVDVIQTRFYPFHDTTWHPLSHCGSCGAPYGGAPTLPFSHTSDGALSRLLLCIENETALPLPDIVYAFQYFQVLRRMASLLSSSRLKRLFYATLANPNDQDLAFSSKVTFEFRPLHQRRTLLRSALWLLDDWPDRFLTQCRAHRITSSTFYGGNHEILPYWFDSIVKRDLDQRTHFVTLREAQSAYSQLQRRGTRISRNKLRESLGTWGVKVAGTVVEVQRLEKLSQEDCLVFFKKAAALMDDPKYETSYRPRLSRNMVLLAALTISDLTLSTLLAMRLSTLSQIFYRWAAAHPGAMATVFSTMIESYSASLPGAGPAFPKRGGGFIAPRCVRPALRRLFMHLLPQLQSLDQFKGALLIPAVIEQTSRI